MAGVNGIFLTHAHLDHSGFIPRLYKDGFQGPVICTPGTQALAKLILIDAGYLEEENAKYANKSGYSNHAPALPLFTMQDADACMKYFEPYKRDQWHQFQPDLSFRFLRAGHIIGASIIQFQTMLNQKSFIISFSGDIGHNRSLTMKGPKPIMETDLLILESTYGDRRHPRIDALQKLAEYVHWIIQRQGILIIPSFAVGRAQDLIFHLKVLEDRNMIPEIPIYLDSPMATEATNIFQRMPDDQKTLDAFNDKGGFLPKKFRATSSARESELISGHTGPMVIISSSGMLSGGRILHHLKRHLPNERNLILFTGFQAEGTKGRWLQDHANTDFIRIHHQEIPIKARIETLDALSAHADYEDILEWLKQIRRPPKAIVLNHGSPSSQRALASRINNEFGIKVIPSCEQQVIDICSIKA